MTARVKNHFHEHADDSRAACGEPLGSKPFLLASSNPQRVSCLRCKKVLAARLAAKPVHRQADLSQAFKPEVK